MNQDTLHELIAMLSAYPVVDIYVAGFLDAGSGTAAEILPDPSAAWRKFHPMWGHVYIEVNNELFLLETIEQYSRLHLERVERIACRFELDPDDTFCFTSILRPVLQDGGDQARIVAVETFSPAAMDQDEHAVVAMGLTSEDGEYIFFDALDYHGIHVGAARARDLWVSYFGSKYSLHRIEVAPGHKA
jgi:hypothetical protein